MPRPPLWSFLRVQSPIFQSNDVLGLAETGFVGFGFESARAAWNRFVRAKMTQYLSRQNACVALRASRLALGSVSELVKLGFEY